MLFLEFLIIYFICIDTPIYDQPFSYQGTVSVIPLLHFYLFPLYPQQEPERAMQEIRGSDVRPPHHLQPPTVQRGRAPLCPCWP